MRVRFSHRRPIAAARTCAASLSRKCHAAASLRRSSLRDQSARINPLGACVLLFEQHMANLVCNRQPEHPACIDAGASGDRLDAIDIDGREEWCGAGGSDQREPHRHELRPAGLAGLLQSQHDVAADRFLAPRGREGRVPVADPAVVPHDVHAGLLKDGLRVLPGRRQVGRRHPEVVVGTDDDRRRQPTASHPMSTPPGFPRLLVHAERAGLFTHERWALSLRKWTVRRPRSPGS